MSTIQLKRGLAANIPATAALGEPVYTTDDQTLHFGTGSAVVPLKIAAANVVGLTNTVSEPVNSQTGTTYTLLASDSGKLVTLFNAAAIALTIPSGVFTSGQFSDFQNTGASDVTITPTGTTINAASNFVLHGGQGIRVIFDGTVFRVITGRSVVAKSAVGSQWLNSVAADGTHTSTQPAFTDISGAAVVGQIPSLPASQITSGTLGVVVGGTGASLSATGGASNVLKQTSVGGVVTVGQLAFTDISGAITSAQLPASFTVDGGTF